MTQPSVPKSEISQLYDSVKDWKKQREKEISSQITDAKKRKKQLEDDIRKLQKQLQDTVSLEETLQVQQTNLDAEELQQMQQGLVKGLQASKQLLEQRNTLLQQSRKIRQDRVDSIVQESQYKELITEYQQFQKSQEQLQQLPVSYRQAILQHHANVRQQLQPIFLATTQPLVKTEKPAVSVGLVASIEPNFTEPEAMAIVLPVPFSVYTHPVAGDDSLVQVLSYRCCAAITAALKRVGLKQVSFHFEDFQGLLSIQLWLEKQKPSGDIKQALFLEMEKMRQQSSELRATNVHVDVSWVDPALFGSGE